ncbi:hypothetical protein GGI1_05480 [Acidithiobacillus sp. GGI-221]|nr:hypothetical protein GGI1_05480 [Acidithiobacillus sp. GGI-221]
MGTMELDNYTIQLKPGGVARVAVWTTTDDMMRDEDGCVHYEIDHGAQKYVLHILHRDQSYGNAGFSRRSPVTLNSGRCSCTNLAPAHGMIIQKRTAKSACPIFLAVNRKRLPVKTCAP